MQQSCNVDLGGFKTVAFDWGQIHVRGGCLGKATPITFQTIPLKAPREAHSKIFIKLSMTESWLSKATTGQGNVRPCVFGRTSLLELLREKVQKFANGELDDEDEDQEYDPMDEVNAPVLDSPAGKRARACYFCRHSSRRKPGLVEK